MPSDQTRNVSLTAELNAFIRDQVASGQYQNASEVVRASLRLLQQQEQRHKRRQTSPTAGRDQCDGNKTSRTGPGSRAGGEMGALIRAHDWSASPLGPSATWPQALKTAVSLMLQARQPAYIAWGPEQISLYNDGYIPILGTKHPAGLGQPAATLWAEIWDTLGPINAAVLSGEAQWFEDMPFALAGREREVSWFSFSYTPLRDESDRIAGIFCVAQETTDKVLADRRAGAERERLVRMFEQAPGFVALLEGPGAPV